MFSALLLLTSFGFGQNLLQNPGFEDGTGVYPDFWATYVQQGNPAFDWVTDIFHTGAKSVRITHADSATSSFYQKVAVQPDFRYLVSGYIKTAAVDSGANWWEGGAQLRIDGDVIGAWWDNMTGRLAGTHDWTYVELEITTTSDADTIEVHCKLGEGLKIIGTAWYDDISMEEIGPVGQWFVNGDFETEDPNDPGWPFGWIRESNSGVTFVWDNTISHGGSYSGKIENIVGSDNEGMWSQQTGPEPYGWVDGAYYKVSGWIKTDTLVGGRGACLITAWDNHSVGGVELHGSNDWTYIEEIVMYNETGWYGIRCYSGTDGTIAGSAWFDDVNVEFIGIPPTAPTNLTADYDGTTITLNWDASTPGSFDIDYYLIKKIIEDDTVGNIKLNPGFEDPGDPPTFPAYWHTWDYGSTPPTTFTWDFLNPLSGIACVAIEQNGNGWGMVYKHKSPPSGEKGFDVLLRGFVATDNVSGGNGAYIGFGYGSEVSRGLFGTNDYTKVTDYACLDGGKYVCCLLGRIGQSVSGKAWFDDVTVTPFDSVGESTVLTFVDPEVIIPDTTYYYSVRCVDVTGQYSIPTFIKVDLVLPDSVTLLSPRNGSRVREARLEWERLIGVDGYRVVVKKSGVQVWMADNVTNNYVVVPSAQLTDDSTYTWTVQYINNGVYSALSEEWSFVYTKWPTIFDYVSDLSETYWQNGWGSGNKDLSNDGNPITIAGVVYNKGLGLHAPAEVHYALAGTNYDYFMAFIGHDDEANGGNGVIFKVVVDNDTSFVSGVMNWGDPGELIKVDVTGADTLKLLIDDNGNGGYDHADWADALLYNFGAQGIEDEKAILPATTALIGNYPNPFNPTTTIDFQLHKAAKVTVEIYNILGQKVATPVHNKNYLAGKYNIVWDATNDSGQQVASGIYLYRFKAGNFNKVKKMILLR